QSATNGAQSVHTFDLSSPVYNLSFTIYDVNRDVTTTAIDDIQVILTKQDGSLYTLQPADYTTGATNTYNGSSFIGTADGSSNVVINGIPEWIVKIRFIYENSGTGAINTIQDIAIGDFTYCTPLDSDGDGVFDYIDLDSDNDGIPDNFEAQTTADYIAPSGGYNNFGIDLAYGSGFTPVNTDETLTNSDTVPDYLDLDSDGDGTFDILESNFTTITPNSGGRATGEVGENGLLNTLDNGDTYVDVNGSFGNNITDNFTDSDNDVNIGGDLDYRDNFVGVDTDGDGVANADDIDDDNDGIPDVNESTNIALAGTASMSSQLGGRSADNAIDGITSGNNNQLLAHTNSTTPTEWWEVDLGSQQEINQINIFNRDDCCQGRLANVYVLISDTPFPSDPTDLAGALSNADFTFQLSSSESGDPVIDVPNVTGRYVRLQKSGTNLGDNAINIHEVQVYSPLDSDNDGVIDSLDIDADNDGIPDNIEAQPTIGYETPSNVDTDNDGLDDAYDTDCAPCGSITGVDLSEPRNTDNFDEPDYLDSDSDNDGIPDIQENGDSDNAISGNDDDGDGLDNNFEGSDTNDGYDVNDEIDTPSTDLPDVDSDVTTDDVDYRDDDDDPVSPNYSGNTLWLRADKNVTGSANVTLWEDQTASLDFVATSGQEPNATVNLLNFNPTVTFTPANNDVLTYTGNLNPRTMYIVYNDTSTAQYTTPFTNNDADGIGHGHSDDTQVYNATYTPTDVINGEEYISGLSSNLLTSSRPDNFEMQTRVFNSNISNEDRTYYVGRDRNFATRVINGSVAEVILYSDVHTDTRKQQVETYLAIKYGFTLDNTDNSGTIIEGDYALSDGSTKIWNYTANSTYHNDVAGIGRDDAMVLAQYQSKSINSDAVITIGLSAISDANENNSNFSTGFTTNKDFLLWGNDNGTISSTTTTELICAPEITLGRTWKIVENGSVGSVQIAIEEDAIDDNLTTANTIKVLKVADDASFTTNVEYFPLTYTSINSENVYETTYDFNGTKYFTYAEINGIFWNGSTSTWTGGNNSSVTGAPSTEAADVDKVMIIDAEGTENHATMPDSAIVECVWIKENSKLMVQDDNYLEFDEDFILNGELRLIGNGQLVQTHIGLSNVQGNGKLFRDQSTTVPNVYRYNYWSSPVREIGANSFRVAEVLHDGNVPTFENSPEIDITWTDGYDGMPGVTATAPDYTDGTPLTLSSYWIYSFLNGVDASGWVQQRQTGILQRGQGYTMKSTGQNPQNFTFIGSPNDGSITFNFLANTTSVLGNPYPSAIDADKFITTNINSIEGTLYFWEHTGEDNIVEGASTGHNITGYQGGYSQRNLAMGIAASNVASTAPTVFDWEDASIISNEVVQTVDDIKATVSFSSGTPILSDISSILSPLDLGIINSDGESDYSITVNFDQKVDVKSIQLSNNTLLGALSLPITLDARGSSTPVSSILSGFLDNTVTVNWEDITSFTISSSSNFNIQLQDISVELGNQPSLGNGTYYAPNQYISVGQAFFVSSSDTGGTVRFENDQRLYESDDYISGGTRFFKTSGKTSTTTQTTGSTLPILKLGFNYKASGISDDLHRQIGISFRRGNTFGYENGFDSEIFDIQATDFYWNFPEYSDKNYIIAGVSQLTENLEVPVVFSVNTNEAISIEIDEVENIDGSIYLFDKLTNQYYELSTDDEKKVSLDLENGEYRNRFYITFANQNETLSTEGEVLNSSLNAFVDNGNNEIVINNADNLKLKKASLYNVLGQEIQSWNSFENTNEERLSINKLPTGFYIFNLETEKGRLSKKVVVE
ncbi:discoidin domain-containing protein, partial [Polaribacter sp.]|nr:discoidin domain-containing protein [Polaribacter sp.]